MLNLFTSSKSLPVRRCLAFLSTVFICATIQAQEPSPKVDPYNVPSEVDTCLKPFPELTLNGEINPFYLTGDFDGDGKLDFAVQVSRKEAKGILFCLSTQKNPLLVGAGSGLVWPSTEPWRFDAWSIVPKNNNRARTVKVKYDAVLLDVKETANGLLYWTGSSLTWLPLGD
jgi:hypothetical protein